MKMVRMLVGMLGGMALMLSACGSQADQVQESEKGSSNSVPATGTYPDGSTPQFSGKRLRLTVDGNEVIIAMYDNTAADAYLERLPLDNVEFYDLSGIEKPARNDGAPFSIADEDPGYDPVAGEMVIYRPWGSFTIFYEDFRHSNERVPLGVVESGLEVLSGEEDDFTGTIEFME